MPNQHSVKPEAFSTVAALTGMTFVTGLIDAASVLGLGHVFVANMTGNTVFIGFSLFGQGGVWLAAALSALGSFLCGATLGGRATRSPQPWALQAALALDVALQALAACFAWTAGSHTLSLVILLAAAMGIRTAIVRALAVPDLPTTVLTMTLTGIAADSTLAGGDNPRLARRLTAVAVMLLGGSAGALLFSRAPSYVIPVAALVEAAAALALTYRA